MNGDHYALLVYLVSPNTCDFTNHSVVKVTWGEWTRVRFPN